MEESGKIQNPDSEKLNRLKYAQELREKMDKMDKMHRERQEEEGQRTIENRQKSMVRQSTGLLPLAEPKSKRFSLFEVFNGMFYGFGAGAIVVALSTLLVVWIYAGNAFSSIEGDILMPFLVISGLVGGVIGAIIGGIIANPLRRKLKKSSSKFINWK